LTDINELKELREDVEAIIDSEMYPSISRYLKAEGDGGSDPAPERYAAVDDIYHGEDALGEYDDEHGVDDGVSDMEIRTPAMAMVHELLAEAWHEGNG
jgi:hypothetical protein